MISLNLLSNKKKEELKFRGIYLISKHLMIILLIFIFLVSVFLFAVNNVLSKTLNTLSEESLINVDSQTYNTNLEKINKIILSTREIQNEFIDYSKLLIETTNLIPPNVKLASFSINTKNNKVLFKGIAPQRSDLIKFQKNMEDSPIFSNVESPISNILKKDNINFDITADLILKDTYEDKK